MSGTVIKLGDGREVDDPTVEAIMDALFPPQFPSAVDQDSDAKSAMFVEAEHPRLHGRFADKNVEPFREDLHPRGFHGHWLEKPKLPDPQFYRGQPPIPTERAVDIFHGFQHGDLISSVERVNVRDKTIHLYGRFHKVSTKDKAGQWHIELRPDKTVYLSLIYLLPQHQDAGFVSSFVRNYEQALQHEGFTKHELEAVSIGAYAWARAGFHFKTPADMEKLIHENPETGDRKLVLSSIAIPPVVPDSEIKDFLAHFPTHEQITSGVLPGDGSVFVHESDIAQYGRDHQWDLHGHKMWLGKAFLLFNPWNGVKDLTPAADEKGIEQQLAATLYDAWCQEQEKNPDAPTLAGLGDDGGMFFDDGDFWDRVEARAGGKAFVELEHPRLHGRFMHKPKAGTVWFRHANTPPNYLPKYGDQRMPFVYLTDHDLLMIGKPGTHHEHMPLEEVGFPPGTRGVDVLGAKSVAGVIFDRPHPRPGVFVMEDREGIPTALLHRLRREFPDLPVHDARTDGSFMRPHSNEWKSADWADGGTQEWNVDDVLGAFSTKAADMTAFSLDTLRVIADNAGAKGAVEVEGYDRDGHHVAPYVRQMETSWHITDNAKFKFDPKKRPQNNTTLGGDWPEPGLFMSKDPEAWVNGYDYVRPFIAEIEHPPLKEFGGHSGEGFLPAEAFPQSQVKRVIPLDEYVREHYHEPGWIESWHQDDLPARFPSDYRYTGPDAREMSKDVVRQHKRRVTEYLRGDRPQVFQRYDDNGEKIPLRKADGSLKRPGKRLPRPDAIGAAV